MNITIDRKVIEQALYALNYVIPLVNHRRCAIECMPLHQAAKALREALAQPQPVQEPVAVVKWQIGGIAVHIVGDVNVGDLLYTSPQAQPAQPPSDERLCEAMRKAGDELRRLEQSSREGWRYSDELEQERKRLKSDKDDWKDASFVFKERAVKAETRIAELEAANAELLEALISIAEDSPDEGARECAMDVIKKHGGAA